jgi:hypothetical protein
MKSGLRIADKEGNHLVVTLEQILEECTYGSSIAWTIVFLEASGDLGEERSMLDVMEQANTMDSGYLLSWDSLLDLSSRLWTLEDITLLGDSSSARLHRYSSTRAMVQACSVSIELIDSGFWEVFSEDEAFIARLKNRFASVKRITLDDLPD